MQSDLRTKVLALRKNLAQSELEKKSKAACELLARWVDLRAEKDWTIGIYRPMNPNLNREADPSDLVLDHRMSRHRFAYPRVLSITEGLMEFAIPLHPSDWRTGAYGLMEPRWELPAVKPEEFDAVIVPGAVFGLEGERIGLGAGFYDRFLQKIPSVLRIGFCLEVQLMSESIPQNPWDARMDLIVTEGGVHETRIRA